MGLIEAMVRWETYLNYIGHLAGYEERTYDYESDSLGVPLLELVRKSIKMIKNLRIFSNDNLDEYDLLLFDQNRSTNDSRDKLLPLIED